jgi:hypothetical protein
MSELYARIIYIGKLINRENSPKYEEISRQKFTQAQT